MTACRLVLSTPRCSRRRWLAAIAVGLGAPALPAWALSPGPLAFPRDHGAHPDTRIEWWYVTGWLREDGSAAPVHGFQVTFFRAAGPAADAPASAGRFAPRQLLFAHAAVTDMRQRRLRHDQRIARQGFGIAEAAVDDTGLALQGWTLSREGGGVDGRYRAAVTSERAGFSLTLALDTTQPRLLQGDAGWSRKGPLPEQASRYYSQPQLAVAGTLSLEGAPHPVRGQAWLDHEWSDTLLDPRAAGWDWIGMNLADGSALTAFRVRDRTGAALWAGGSLRRAGEREARAFAPEQVRFTALRTWRSAATGATYPVEWQIETPAGRHRVRPRLDDQELDSRASTGTVYWEGLADLLDEAGRPVGAGYLELTGYSGALRL